MRTPSISSVGYAPSTVPTEATQLQRYLLDELTRISAAISALAEGHLEMAYAAPAKPREGDIRLASGAPNWNPGSGKGVYCYYGSAWHYLG